MTDSTMIATSETLADPSELKSKLISGSEKVQLQIIPTLAATGEAGLEILREFLQERQALPPNIVNGKIYQVLYSANHPPTTEFLKSHFPSGIAALNSERGIDYSELQQLLIQQNFEAADQLTLQKLCEMAGATAIQRKWLYFSEAENLPVTDLQTINTLWFIYSEGKFGFSVQRELWLGVGKNWEKLWPIIGWKKDNAWTRYPHEFTWNLTAPRGHLPLSNQLRGVRVMASLLSHPAWQN